MRGVWRFGHGLVGCDLRQGSRCEADQVRWLRQITATLLALVCLVSTCQPGATNGLCRRELERDGLVVGRDIFLAVREES